MFSLIHSPAQPEQGFDNLRMTRSPVAAEFGVAPSDHRAIEPHCGKGSIGRGYVSHTYEVLRHGSAVPAHHGMAPCHHSAVSLQSCESLLRCKHLLHSVYEPLLDCWIHGPSGTAVPPRHHRAVSLHSSEGSCGGAEPHHPISKLFCRSPEIAAVAWAAPGNDRPVGLQRGIGAQPRSNADYPGRDLVLDGCAVAPHLLVAPCDEGAIGLQSRECEALGREHSHHIS
mmetsp:Transcript_36312/g.73169  ORF Transcript_36312/g.73169 Transcript_36312/m.73169 type:complete len:227 (-) Transcript_36312:781-1461(-)